MYSHKGLVIIIYIINLTFQCESRTISDSSEIRVIAESNNKSSMKEEPLKDAETSKLRNIEVVIAENESDKSAGKRRVRKLWNKLGKINDRKRRGLLSGPNSYKSLGPVFASSGEYDSDGPPPHYGQNEHREYYYPPPSSSREETHSEEHHSYGPYLPPHHDHPQPGYSLTPPSVEHDEKPAEEPEYAPYPPAEEHHHHPEPEHYPYPPAEEHHYHSEEVKCDHHPSKEPTFGPYPPPKEPEHDHSEPEQHHPEPEQHLYPPAEESSYVLYPPHSPPENVHKTESNLKPSKELLAIAEKQIDQDMIKMHTKSNLKPNRALLDIAEKHIREGKEHHESNVKTHYGPPSTSYGVPVSSVKEEHKESSVETHNGPPSTSYGVPISSVPNPSHEIQPPHESHTHEHKNEEVKTPPSTAYGIPDSKIEQTFSKETHKEETNSHPDFVAVNEAKPYDLHSSSYGAPQKSVTSFTSQSTNIKPFFALPESNRAFRFDSRNTNSINEIDGSKKKRETKYVMIPIEKFNELTECMHKSLSSAYTLKIEDGTLIKE